MKNQPIEKLAALIKSQAILNAVKEIEGQIAYIDVVANCIQGAILAAHYRNMANNYSDILHSAVSLEQDSIIYTLAQSLTQLTSSIPLHDIGPAVQVGITVYKEAHPEYNALSRAAAELLNPVKVKGTLNGWMLVAVAPGQDMKDPVGQRIVYADGGQCTSRIVSIDKENARVTTASGSIYALKLPSGLCRNLVQPEAMQALGF